MVSRLSGLGVNESNVISDRSHINDPIRAQLITPRILFIELEIRPRDTNQPEFRLSLALHEFTRNRFTFKYPIKDGDGRPALPLDMYMRKLEDNLFQRKSDPVLLGKIQSTFDGCAFTLEGQVDGLPLSSNIYSTSPITLEGVLRLARQYIEVAKHQRHDPNHRQFSHYAHPLQQSSPNALDLSIGDCV